MCKTGAVTGSMPWQLALIAVKARVNGRDLTVEEVEELDDLDILFLVGHVLGKRCLGSRHLTILRVDGALLWGDLMAASDSELIALWDQWVEYCEERAREVQRQTEQAKHGR